MPKLKCFYLGLDPAHLSLRFGNGPFYHLFVRQFEVDIVEAGLKITFDNYTWVHLSLNGSPQSSHFVVLTFIYIEDWTWRKIPRRYVFFGILSLRRAIHKMLK